MRFTNRPASLRECRRRLSSLEWQRRRAGYAAWAFTKADGRATEWGGLHDDLFDTSWDAELGYAFYPPHKARVNCARFAGG